MNEPLLTEQISNHPIFTNVERFVNVTLQQANSNNKTFEFWYDVTYKLDEEDITPTISQPSINRIFTDANTKLLMRNPTTFEPIENTEWDGISEDDYDKYLWYYGWDAITNMINTETNIANMIRQYILLNDTENYFN